MTRAIACIILAAGQGTRMRSRTPKVLHKVGGRAMLDWAIDAAQGLGCVRIVVVVGNHSPEVRAHAAGRLGEAAIAVQDPPLGTAHAVASARAQLADFDGDVLVSYADGPLVRAGTIAPLLAVRAGGADLAVLAFEAADPTGYGRLVLDKDGELLRIVEQKEGTPEELAITLCNSGVICADRAQMFDWLSRVKNENAKGEYYLTDLAALCRADGKSARTAVTAAEDVLGANSRAELAQAEAAFQARMRAHWLQAGVTMIDPATVYFSHDTALAEDVTLEPGVVFGPGVTVARGSTIRAYSHLEGAHVGEDCVVGPFARLRPGARLERAVKIGNFVEVKNATFGEKAQASHLTYVGDARVGARANLGCGTITCNYDGFDKFETVIGEDAFIGSDTALVAPVTVGARAYTGSGSVITRDVPDGALAVGRGRQRDVEGWADAFRARKAAERKSKP